MKKILLLTDVAFWEKNAGHCVRILQLVRTLSVNTRLTIAFLERSSIDEATLAATLHCEMIIPERHRPLRPAQYAQLLRKRLRQTSFDCCIVEFIHCSFYLDCLPAATHTILDIHDILCERKASFEHYDNYDQHPDSLTKEIEWATYDLYDHLMVLCETDRRLLGADFPAERLLLCPHPARVTPKMIRPDVRNIGFVGSAWLPNKDGIEQFLLECWPELARRHPVNLTIYGTVANRLISRNWRPRVQITGFVEDTPSIYDSCDLMINPVRFGAGLKIKNIEAMAYGLPLVTTTHGARGLEKAIDHALCIADDPAVWVSVLSDLIEDATARIAFSHNATRFIAENYSEEVCFGPLLNLISSLPQPIPCPATLP